MDNLSGSTTGDKYSSADGFCDEFPGRYDGTISGSNYPNDSVTLSGAFDPLSGTWTPSQTSSWLSGYLEVAAPFDTVSAGAVSLSYSSSASLAPSITNVRLIEPAYYLQGVSVQTEAEVTVDWRGQAPDSVEFTYNGATATVGGANTVTWPFNAGESADSISVVAIQGSNRSAPYTLAVPKPAVPSWAGTAGDWSGLPGIQYSAESNWPVPNAIQTLSNLPFLSGDWGFGSATSSLGLAANSDGTPGTGVFTGNFATKLGGANINLPFTGSSETTLSCDNLTMTGAMQVPVASLGWSDSFGVADLVPGLETLACGLSAPLCSAIRSATFAKASASASINGTGSFAAPSSNGNIAWTGGGISGTVDASAALNLIPPFLSKVAELGVAAEAGGCIGFQMVPTISVDSLGVGIEATGTARLLGIGGSESIQWSEGSCPNVSAAAIIASAQRGLYRADAPQLSAASAANERFDVPGDGQPNVAFNPNPQGAVLAAAVWRSAPKTGDRPGGSISLRVFRDGQWSSPLAVTDDAAADMSPDVAFDSNGNLVVVYVRNGSVAAIPTEISGAENFANGLELHYALVNPGTLSVASSGILTSNQLADLAPTLRVDPNGVVHLFWQRNPGLELLGSNTDPVQILARHWSGGTWSAEAVAVDNVAGQFGWYPAVWDADTALVALVQDTNNNLDDGGDREIHVFERSAGTWGTTPVAVTQDGITEDHAPIATYRNGSPQLWWVRGAAVNYLDGDLQGTPTALTAPGDAIGMDFGFAVVRADNQIDLLWPDSTDLRALNRSGGTWGAAQTLLNSGASITPLAVTRNTLDQRIRAEVERAILPDGSLAATATVRLASPDGGLEEPPAAPDAPVIVRSEAGDGEVILLVSVASNNGSPITGYDAQCSDGTNAFTGTSSSSQITVAGLTNGDSYTCTVTATNGVGTSAASVSSSAVTPEEQLTSGLPAWLIYSATKDEN